MITYLKKYQTDFRANSKLAIPIMLGQLGQIATNFADNIMVGRLGAAPLAAVSLSIAIYIIFAIVGLGISFALPPLVAEAKASNRQNRISQYFKHSLTINLAFALITLVIMLGLIPFLHLMGQESEVTELAIPYLQISAISMVPMMIFQTFRCYSDGMSETKPPMIAMIVGNVLNILLNYMLIFGKWGAPELGVTGAAIGTLISRIVMIVVLVAILYRWKGIWQNIATAKYFVYKKKLYLKMLSISIPLALQMFFEVSAFAGVAIIMGSLGKEAQAAHQIAINLASIPFLICSGFAMAASVRVGSQLGLKSYIGMRNAGMSAFIQVFVFMSMSAILFLISRHSLPTLYINNIEVLDIAATLLIFAALFQIPDGLQVVVLGALRGVQDVKFPTLITFIAYWLVGVPVGVILAFYYSMGPSGLWIGLVLGLTVSAFFLLKRFFRVLKTKP